MSESGRERGDVLLTLARAALERHLLGREPPGLPDEAWLKKPGAVFVTLTLDGDLRGCIGSLEADRPLNEDVAANAVAAASRDPRFPPVTPDELPRLRVEVSLLEPAEALPVVGEEEAIETLRPGIDGVVLEHRHGRSTFLPQVWEQLPEPAAFLRQLKRKAGLPGDGWDDSIRLSRYGVCKWKENEEEP
jgi:AmmeMemoRadiSam system protein A